LTVSVGVIRVVPPAVAEMTVVMLEATLTAVTVKVVLFEPDGIVTLDGTLAAPVLLLDRVTARPPAGALALIVTRPLSVALPVMV
jgi:hypothetical protein